MENYRTSSHSRYDIKYHFVWVTKYRKPMLTGEVGLRLRELVREICRTNEIEILQGAVSRGPCACAAVVSAKPVAQQDHAVYQGQDVAKADDGVQAYPKTVLGSAFVGTRATSWPASGNVTDEAIMEYIRHQDGLNPTMAVTISK